MLLNKEILTELCQDYERDIVKKGILKYVSNTEHFNDLTMLLVDQDHIKKDPNSIDKAIDLARNHDIRIYGLMILYNNIKISSHDKETTLVEQLIRYAKGFDIKEIIEEIDIKNFRP